MQSVSLYHRMSFDERGPQSAGREKTQTAEIKIKALSHHRAG
jgi:hypothetical protein